MSCSQNLAGSERVGQTFGLLSAEMSAREIGPVTPSESFKHDVHPLAQRASGYVSPSPDTLPIHHAMNEICSHGSSPLFPSVDSKCERHWIRIFLLK
jgi:hypothetical protein